MMKRVWWVGTILRFGGKDDDENDESEDSDNDTEPFWAAN